jgi:RNA polymerase sigma-70 factor (ECF subfamily)
MQKVKEFERLTDTEVIGKILKGETSLFELLIRRNNPFLYKVGRTYGYNHHDTEDLMQETYIQAFYALNKFESRSQFKTWLTRIMINNCYQKKQKHSYQKEVLTEQFTNQNTIAMFQNAANTQKTILNKELGHVMENALQQIPENYRMVFTLRELTGLSVSETAELLNISQTNVKARLSRAKTLLKTEIEKMYTPEDIYEFNLVYCDRIVERVMSQLIK